jgi:cyclase
MLATRVIPCLLLADGGLVKTERFRKPRYVGDPINAVRIFNDKFVDELALFDISASRSGRPPDFDLVEKIISEAFMPVCYGGGVRSVEDARMLHSVGVEKVAVNDASFERPDLVGQLADRFGSQSVVGSVDCKRGLWGGPKVYRHSSGRRMAIEPAEHARSLQVQGAGELFVTSVDRDGTMSGYDLEVLRSVTAAVDVPVVGCGGAGSLEDMVRAVAEAGISAAAAGSLFVYRGRRRAVLISYPDQHELRRAFGPLEADGGD